MISVSVGIGVGGAVCHDLAQAENALGL